MNPSSEREALQRLTNAVAHHLGIGTQTTHLKGFVYSEDIRKEMHAAHSQARAALSTQPQQAGVKDSLTAQHEQAGWMPIEAMPLDEIESAPGHFDKWAKDWLLLGRQDEHGWVSWVGTLEAGMWLERDSSRACGDSEKPSHWMPLPPVPGQEGGG